MNWIKENKFVFGFIVVMVIGLGVGGWFVLGAKGRSDDATNEYERRVAELNRLQKLAIFPNQKNLDQILAQQNEVHTEVSALASSFATQQIPLDEITPEVFQDKLKASVTAVKAKAAGGSPAVKLPDKFFLGFDRYETAPPPKEAASVLGRELKAIEWLANQLIESPIAELKKLERDDLPEEKGRIRAQEKKPTASAKPAPGKPADKAVKADKGGVNYEIEKHRIELVFVADQARFRKFLNAVVAYKGQYFIPRVLSVKNEKTQAPPRVAEAAAVPAPPSPADAAAPAGAPAAAAAAAATPAAVSTYIVGEEKIEVTLTLELVDFEEVGSK